MLICSDNRYILIGRQLNAHLSTLLEGHVFFFQKALTRCFESHTELKCCHAPLAWLRGIAGNRKERYWLCDAKSRGKRSVTERGSVHWKDMRDFWWWWWNLTSFVTGWCVEFVYKRIEKRKRANLSSIKSWQLRSCSTNTLLNSLHVWWNALQKEIEVISRDREGMCSRGGIKTLDVIFLDKKEQREQLWPKKKLAHTRVLLLWMDYSAKICIVWLRCCSIMPVRIDRRTKGNRSQVQDLRLGSVCTLALLEANLRNVGSGTIQATSFCTALHPISQWHQIQSSGFVLMMIRHRMRYSKHTFEQTMSNILFWCHSTASRNACTSASDHSRSLS